MYRSPRPLPGLEALSLDGQAVLLRADLNVPLELDGRLRSDARIRAVLPSLRQLISAGARVAVASHLGRPNGRKDPTASLEPVAVRLGELMGIDIAMAHDCVGEGVTALVRQLQPGQVACLENLRFHGGEEANEPSFARALTKPFDIYVGDAFGAAHRRHASIVGVLPLVPACATGPLMLREVSGLERLLTDPDGPFVAVVGGAKVADKLGMLQSLIAQVDVLMVGGAMAYTFLQAQGVGVGRSPVAHNVLASARELLQRAARRGCEVLLPTDHVAATEAQPGAAPVTVADPNLPADYFGLDIGPKTAARYASRVRAAGRALWNGPMGVAEWPAFAGGSHAVAHAMADTTGYSVVGGGDALAVLDALELHDKVDHVSTGGGATLAYLQHGTLPGLEALRQRG